MPDSDEALSYEALATRHQKLLSEYSALISFNSSLYKRLSVSAMASTVLRNRPGIPQEYSRDLKEIQMEGVELARQAGLADDRTLNAVKSYLRSAQRSGRQLGRRSLRSHTSNTITKSAAEKTINSAVQKRRSAIFYALGKIPPSLNKARAALAFEVLVDDDDDGPPNALCALGVEEARRSFKANIGRRRQALLSGSAMDSSARTYEPYWLASYLRYYEIFEPTDARKMLLSESRDIEIQLTQQAATVASGSMAPFELAGFLDSMFSYGQCRTTRAVLWRIARRTIPSILRLQRTDGAWSDWLRDPKSRKSPPDLFPDASTTAAAISLLVQYGLPEECERAFPLSGEWLVVAQTSDGCWISPPGSARGLPLSTTVRVLRALRSTGFPSDHPAIAKGESYLLSQQEPPGVWSERSGKWQTHLTAEVVEYFQSAATGRGSLNSYLKSARALMLKSEQLTFSEDPFDSSLAVAAAYHGVEHFLYGLLLELDATESFFQDKGATIGLNGALGILERTLQARGKLLNNSRLPFRQQLQHLSTKRDMFIHRAEPIALVDAQSFIQTCRSFVQRYDLELLGVRLD